MGSTTALNFYHTPFAIVGRRGQPECEDGRRAQGPQNSEGKREKFLFFFGREEEKGFLILLVESKMNWNWKGFRYEIFPTPPPASGSAQRAADRRNRYSSTCGKCQACGVMIGQLTALSVRIPHPFVPQTPPTLTRQSDQVPAMPPC